MDSALERILEAANSAPSGENCQPWHFVVRGNIVELHLLPERDQSAYSWGQRASFLANGAVLENLTIAASVEGFSANISYFPNAEDNFHVATVTLSKDDSVHPDPLAAYVGKRVTNRKPFSKEALSKEVRERILEAARASGYGTFVLVEERSAIERLGRVGSTNEEVMLANRSLHHFFFSHVSWTKEEDAEKKIGFYIKTLELPPPAQAMFKLFKHWRVMRVLSQIGFTKIVAKQNAVTNASAAAIGGIVLEGVAPIDFVRIGRTVERVWLTATALGLSFQPLTGVLFFDLLIENGGGSKFFSPAEQETIRTAYARAAEAFQAGDRHVAFMFRVGKGEKPSAQAVRFPFRDAVSVVS